MLRAYSKLLILLISPAVIIGCSKTEEEVSPPVRPAKIFIVGDAASGAIRIFPGEVEASDKAIQAFRVAGELVELPVKAGAKVKKGDLLAKLDPRDYKLRFDDSKAKYDLANVQYKRAGELVKKKLIPIADYDKAKSRWLAAKADLEIAKSNLEYTELRAPFDGVISKTHVENFENVQAKQAIVNIQSTESIDITFQLPELVLARLERGKGHLVTPTVTFDAKPGMQLEATIKEVNTEPDPQTKSYRIVLTMPAPQDFIVISGMTVKVSIDFTPILKAGHDKIIVPVEAVFAPEDVPLESKNRYVWKVDPDTMQVKRQAVTVGELTSAGILVESGIQPGDQIIAAGVHFLQEGQQVKAWKRERGL